MGNEINEVGNKYGRLTVLRQATKEEKNNRHGAFWFCQCECGKTTVVRGFSLRQGNVQSCGCLRHEQIIKSNIERSGGDLTGQRFGKLTVIKEAPSKQNLRGQNLRYWECKCDCGNLLEVNTTSLNTGSRICCDDCVKEKLRQDHLINEVGKKYGLLTVVKYAGQHPNRRLAMWECKCQCGNKRIYVGADLRNGNIKSCGCLKSQGEALITSILSENNFNFAREFSFADLCNYKKDNPARLRFDFAIFDNNNKLLCLIEYQGIQHYKQVGFYKDIDKFNEAQYRDQLKRDYCKIHNIKLVEIPYTDFNKITVEYLKERIGE